jgi:hypothetical protein
MLIERAAAAEPAVCDGGDTPLLSRLGDRNVAPRIADVKSASTEGPRGRIARREGA